MIEVKPLVVEKVNEVKKKFGSAYEHIKLYYISPNVGGTVPCITYNELENFDYIRVKGNEYAEITFQFMIFAVELHDMLKSIAILDEAMCDVLGFEKIYSGPAILNDNDVMTAELRFHAIINDRFQIFK